MQIIASAGAGKTEVVAQQSLTRVPRSHAAEKGEYYASE
jgi:hypothetical protein